MKHHVFDALCGGIAIVVGIAMAGYIIQLSDELDVTKRLVIQCERSASAEPWHQDS